MAAKIILAVFLAFTCAVEHSKAETIHTGDVIITGILCVGSECTSSESWFHEDIRLKEDNLQIHFEDTSTISGFPSNDWRILINDYDRYGENYFKIGDSTAGTDPFRIDAGAPTNAIRIFQNGDVNLGGATVANTISVGAPGFEGTITNVAAGSSATDAVNFGQLEDVQTQVTSNAGDIAQNASDIAANAENISQNASDIAVNASNISQNASDIAANAESISQNASDIASNASNISQNASDIAANAGDIAQNASDITANAENISQNASDIAVNAGDIAQNASDITANTAAIADAVDSLSWLSTDSSGSSSATGSGSIAIGSGASAKTNDIAIGLNSTVTADSSTALGTNTTIDSTNGVAVGADAAVESDAAGGTALGQNARVQTGATNSVALGKDSIASEPNTVSIGSSGNERRLTNVANGINATDAVNVQQLQQAISSIGGDISHLSGRIDELNNRLDDVGSLASAFSALVPNHRAGGNTQISVGTGYYSGSGSMATGIFHYVNDKVLLNTGISTTFKDRGTAWRAGVTFGF